MEFGSAGFGVEILVFQVLGVDLGNKILSNL